MNKAEGYARFFETIDKETPIEEYRQFFDENAYFEDPFQKVKGIDNIYHIFEDMYEKLHQPHFQIQEVLLEGSIAYIKWEFVYQMGVKCDVNTFEGVSRVEFNADDKVKSHIDFWDAGVNVYEKIPVLGSILRMIKRKIHA